jgi:nicotinamidase-related amidase
LALDLAKLANPAHTALVTSEIQRGVAGDLSQLPELAEQARKILPNIDALARAARAAGITVIHCTAQRRPDGKGANSNARIFQYMARAELALLPGSDAADIVPEVGVEPADIILPRLHGLSPFQGTELDFVLRNLGVATVVGTGVSVNVALQALTYDAVNSGYQVVLPRDAVAGFPAEYVDAVFANSLGAVATLPTTAELLAAWEAQQA